MLSKDQVTRFFADPDWDAAKQLLTERIEIIRDEFEQQQDILLVDIYKKRGELTTIRFVLNTLEKAVIAEFVKEDESNAKR